MNFFTFKWGNKYGSEYVNRLYKSIAKHYDNTFTFYCITDNNKDILPEIKIIDYERFDPFDYPKDKIFTREKLVLMKLFTEGVNVWVDLDILIHNNITQLVNNKKEKPTFIWNYWNWDVKKNKESYGRGNTCYINSSFVRWENNQGEHIFDNLWKNREYAFYTYKSLDKYLFYQHWQKGDLEFWDDGLWYNYNFSSPKYTFNKDAVGCLFNTSHDLNACELHEAKGWAYDLWTS